MPNLSSQPAIPFMRGRCYSFVTALGLMLGAASPAMAGIIAEEDYGAVVATVEDVSATGDADASPIVGQPVTTAESVPDAIAGGSAPTHI